MKKISLQDVANKLGLSKATVSLVLSGKAKGCRISEETCKKVRSTAEEMNYQPNEIARSLSTGMTMLIGVVVTDISNEFFGRLTFYIQEQAKKYGYSVITANTNENLEEFNNVVTMLLNKQIDCIILVPVDSGEDIGRRIIDSHVPMVQIDRYYPDLNANYIVVNNYEASYKAIERMIRNGCRKIAIVCYDINLNALIDRKRGCIEVLKRYNFYDESLVKNIHYENQEDEIKNAIRSISKKRDKIDAVFFCSRRVFVTGLKYMYKENIKIPEDMQVLCFDKIDTFSLADIPIHYIEQPIKDMGEKAVDILMEQMDGSTDVQHCVFKAKLGYINN